MEKNKCSTRQIGFYEKYFKRPLDFILAIIALFLLSPMLLVTAVLIKKKLGSPVLFTQYRPGLDGKPFKLYKFRTMTDAKDSQGNLLSDEVRLTKFGMRLRNTSIDELPELLNIVMGDMSIIGPRPQLIRDMVFMTKEQQRRHSVRPGLSGLAQVNGRNGISWEWKLTYDLGYIDRGITFAGDMRLIIETLYKAKKQEGITDGENATALDYGDALLKAGKISKKQYESGQKQAKKILEKL